MYISDGQGTFGEASVLAFTHGSIGTGLWGNVTPHGSHIEVDLQVDIYVNTENLA